jgi:hypothetical protein
MESVRASHQRPRRRQQREWHHPGLPLGCCREGRSRCSGGLVSRLHVFGWLGDKSFGILGRKGLASHGVALDRMRSRDQGGGIADASCYQRCGGVVAKEPTSRRWGFLVSQMVLWMSFITGRTGCRLGCQGRIGCSLRQ